MTPEAQIAAVIEILSQEDDGAQAVQRLRQDLRRRRYAGSGDRNAISGRFWAIQRAMARLSWHIEKHGAAVGGRSLAIAALCLVDGLDADACAACFGGASPHAAHALDDAELALAAGLAGGDLDDAAMPDWARLEWPAHLMEDAAAAIGEGFEDELAAMRGEAGTDIRINPLKVEDRRRFRDKIAGRGIRCHPTRTSPIGIRLERRVRVEELGEYRHGHFEIQDEASQIAALLCDARPGMQVADICAGAAGKSLVMAAMMENKGRILALDSDAVRLERGAARISRAGIHNIERHAVAQDWGTKRYRAKFDRVVVDAPCSGSGTWRRAVDARWRYDAGAMARNLETQAGLLDRARSMVAPGGRVIYITCSLLHSECEAQVARILGEADELEPLDLAGIWGEVVGEAGCPPTRDGMLRLLPGRDGTDGFFVAVLGRRDE